MAGGALEPRSVATCRCHEKCASARSILGWFWQFAPWSTELGGALFPSRMATVALGVLGVMGGMLSITGIFGMAAYSVSKRLQELGIRVALGAQRREVLQVALGRAFKLLAIGSGLGLVLGLIATKVLAYIVYQATPRDPFVVTGGRAGHAAARSAGYVDPRAARAVGQSFDPAARRLNPGKSSKLQHDGACWYQPRPSPWRCGTGMFPGGGSKVSGALRCRAVCLELSGSIEAFSPQTGFGDRDPGRRPGLV